MQNLWVQADLPFDPHLQVLQSSFHASPSSFLFPWLSVQWDNEDDDDDDDNDDDEEGQRINVHMTWPSLLHPHVLQSSFQLSPGFLLSPLLSVHWAGTGGGHNAMVQLASPLSPHRQVLQSSFQLSPGLLLFPKLSVHCVMGWPRLLSPTPGKLTLSPPSLLLFLVSTGSPFTGRGFSGMLQNLFVQPGNKFSVHRHLLQSSIQVSPAILGNPLSLVPQRLVAINDTMRWCF